MNKVEISEDVTVLIYFFQTKKKEKRGCTKTDGHFPSFHKQPLLIS